MGISSKVLQSRTDLSAVRRWTVEWRLGAAASGTRRLHNNNRLVGAHHSSARLDLPRAYQQARRGRQSNNISFAKWREPRAGRHELRGEDDRGILLGRYFCHGLERAQLQRHGVRRNDVRQPRLILRRLGIRPRRRLFWRVARAPLRPLWPCCALVFVGQCDVLI